MTILDLPAITLTSPTQTSVDASPGASPGRPATPSRSSASDERGSAGSPRGRPNSSETRSFVRPKRTSSHSLQSKDGNNGSSLDIELTMDPLSKHILSRTNTPVFTPAIRRPVTPEKLIENPEKRPAPAVQSASTRHDTSTEEPRKELRKGIKAVSFLTRLVGNKKKSTDEDVLEDTSSLHDSRPEGNNAEVFTQPIDSIGYSPKHAQPPAYIKVRSRNKVKQDFDRLFLAQQLYCGKTSGIRRADSNKLRRKSSATAQDANTVWAMEFSRDGKYLAAAGNDAKVRVWAVLSSSEERKQHERQEAKEAKEGHDFNAQPKHLSAPVFQTRPVREYHGHASTVLDLSWSKNNFLLSSSMDKTVRLWHISRPECLCTFKHNDFVPSIAFHPKDDRFFLAGSLDSKLRLWSIPDKAVAFSTQLPDLITAVAFTPDGKHAMAGCLNGLCTFFETEGLKYSTQIHVRSTRGQNAKASKITGMHAHHSSSGETKLLITSNDSRIRLYNFRDKSLELKFKGNENNCSQIRATISDDGRYVVCGSEDRKAFIWPVNHTDGEKRDRRPVEMFEAHDTVATVVCFAPAKTRQHLSKSEDPVYDLCNPPPVTLVSRSERGGSGDLSKLPQENGSTTVITSDGDGATKPPEQSPGYVQRSMHKEGNILITADYTGHIKVFRQDCAWQKRRPDDSDKGSLFSKRGSKIGRQGSVIAKASHPSLRESRSSVSTQSDRILSWRQGILSNSDSKATSRSISPQNPPRSASKTDSNLRSTTNAWNSTLPSATQRMRDPSSSTLLDAPTGLTLEAKNSDNAVPTSIQSEIELRRENDPLLLKGGQSYLFWDSKQWRERAQHFREAHAEHSPERGLGTVSNESIQAAGGPAVANASMTDGTGHLAVRPTVKRDQESFVSRLSDERSTSLSADSDEEEHYDDARESLEEMKCKACGGTAFSARRGKAGGTVLACARCGEQA